MSLEFSYYPVQAVTIRQLLSYYR